MNKIYWLTGLPCSGKTTIGEKLAKKLNAELLDGDTIRKIDNNQDFSMEGRRKHIIAVANEAEIISETKPIVVALVSPIREVREMIKKNPNVIEIFVDCSLHVCVQRDVKGMYALAREGKIKNFTGIDSPYEVPENPHIIVDTERYSVDQCVYDILNYNKPEGKYNLFIGRFQCLPPHEGHIKLIRTVLDEGKKVLIGLRDTPLSDKDPYTIHERRKAFGLIFSKECIRGDVIITKLLDIESVCYGRGVGYDIRKIDLDETTEKVSATKIREGLK